MQHVSLSHLNECIESDTDVVINCSGVHAGTLGGVEDSEVYPARGQTVIVQSPQKYVNWGFLRHCAGSNTGRPSLCEFSHRPFFFIFFKVKFKFIHNFKKKRKII